MKRNLIIGAALIICSVVAAPVFSECTDDVVYEFKHWLKAFPCIDDGVFGCYMYIPEAYGVQEDRFYVKSNPTFYPGEMIFSYAEILTGEVEIKSECLYKNGRKMFCGDKNYMHHMYNWFRRMYNARSSECAQETAGSFDGRLSRLKNLEEKELMLKKEKK